MTELVLAPRPRAISESTGRFELGGEQRRIVIDAGTSGDLLFVAEQLQAAFLSYGKNNWEIGAWNGGPAEEIGVVLRVRDGATENGQGYRLEITPSRITIESSTAQGVFYGVSTLRQILVNDAESLPCLTIKDWPDFEVRGVMLDVSRDKVPTFETTLQLIDKLASWKVNQVQLYLEHTFAYRDHKTVWADASPFTGEEILKLDAYCKARFIELVPNQNLFGHMARWLKHPEYSALAETHGEIPTPWGMNMQGPFSLSPADPGSLELVRGLLDELLPHFSSRQVNVGADETFDVGIGRSKELADERGGAERVYLDYVLDLYREVTARGHVMQFWGDIIETHPELIPDLPKDAVALAWGYEASHPFAELAPKYAAVGVPFYVCPGTSSWCSIAGRTKNALGNLLNAAEAGLANGATGFLNTDWGDRGHWQVLPVSYLGLLAGASFSWALAENRDVELQPALSLHAFGDPSGSLGRLAYDLGNVYAAVGFEPGNSSVLFWALQLGLADIRDGSSRIGSQFQQVTADGLRAALAAIDEAMASLADAQSSATDFELVKAEYENTARMLRHGARRGLVARGELEVDETFDAELTEIIESYKANWLARNRPGGLSDSVGRLESLHADYQ